MSASSAAAPALLQEPSLAGGKSRRFGGQRGAGSHGRGRAGWSCNHGQERMDPFELSTECLRGLGARGEATAPGQGKNRLADSRRNHS